jgi:hypothetical protein
MTWHERVGLRRVIAEVLARSASVHLNANEGVQEELLKSRRC